MSPSGHQVDPQTVSFKSSTHPITRSTDTAPLASRATVPQFSGLRLHSIHSAVPSISGSLIPNPVLRLRPRLTHPTRSLALLQIQNLAPRSYAHVRLAFTHRGLCNKKHISLHPRLHLFSEIPPHPRKQPKPHTRQARSFPFHHPKSNHKPSMTVRCNAINHGASRLPPLSFPHTCTHFALSHNMRHIPSHCNDNEAPFPTPLILILRKNGNCVTPFCVNRTPFT